jgi:threonine synthase
VSDRQILAAFRLSARHGVFAELASTAPIAGLLAMHEQGRLPAGATVVCVLTGHGLKDPDWAVAGAGEPTTIPVDADHAARVLGLA